MQIENWNDLRYLIAVYRSGSLASAARALSVDATTVSRRLAALSEEAGGQLTERAGGALVLTELGNVLLRHAESMEWQAELIAEDLGRESGTLTGSLRVTSVPLIVNRVLTPALRGFFDRYPDLRLELVPDSRDFSLTRREADIALRLARPTQGGLQVKTSRIGALSYGVYAPRGAAEAELEDLPWVGYEDAMAQLPQARWIARTAKREKLSGLRVQDAETALQAVCAGLGKSLLPRVVGDREAGLQRLDSAVPGALPRRDVWLLVREDRARLRSVKAVIDWIGREVAFAP